MDRKPIIVIFLALVALVLIVFTVRRSAGKNKLQVSYIDVGHGDSILISDVTGFDVLIDGGSIKNSAAVLKHLREQEVDDIDVMVLTHPHSDHVGGLIDVLNSRRFPVKSVLYSGYQIDTSRWENFVEAVDQRGLSMKIARFPQTYTWGLSTAYILHPVPGLPVAIEDGESVNNTSVVVRLVHDDIEFLFTGDISAVTETDLLAKDISLDVDILKVAHHGGPLSTGENFLAAVQPSDAVISVGGSSELFPAAQTIEHLLNAGARIWRTDEVGTIVVTSDGKSYSISTEK